MLGPARADQKWQAQAAQGFAAQDFKIDWEAKQATCPQGHPSSSWTPARSQYSKEVIKIKFSTVDCGPCPVRTLCTHSQARQPRRTITLPVEERYRALLAARARETTEEYQTLYPRRAGIEGTLSQGIRAFDLRRSRYVGLIKTHLQHLVIAAAINFVRVGQWLHEIPLAKTRQSSFVRLWAPPVLA